MNDLSTTLAPDDPVQACPGNCAEAMARASSEVDRIARMTGLSRARGHPMNTDFIPGEIRRNEAITAAYQQLGKDAPDNWWIRLAGYVSVQGGCAMQRTQDLDAQTGGRLFVDPADALEALGDANITIFSSIYPANKFMSDCGYARLKECVARGEVEVSDDIMAGLELLQKGDLRGAADMIALYEQTEIVQPVYERYPEVFEGIAAAEEFAAGFPPLRALGYDDQSSIAVAYQCTRDPDQIVPLGDLDISNPQDRVRYYRRLMDRMMVVEGL
ncbi:DUF2515 family protein [Paracoccus fistulariae]|uniref:Uncharacterized protein n=1 Tax=Paracoccus fistulariae TaxID=658446 RepID=A0ABY7SJJ9_9RHOB|nr:hypothetical protein [Paracoccus fistulariae]MDB6180905.1 hypothetical protein [Paracoccus fistulariae]WCR06202.1 hypothetical protein JHX87_11945 [Paracoccus fistulariae]